LITTPPFGNFQMSANGWRILLDWVPFLIFIGLLLFFLKRVGFGKLQADYMARQIEYIDSMQRYCTDHLEETRKISDSLGRIAAALEQKKA
jgi:hypothetical protein